jgi:beta-phosphoglucomutase-like phosphatase (HAD superfamily)
VTGPAAVLWDMDGLLVDSEPLWTVAEVELAAHLGGEFTDELKAAIVGTRLEVAVPTILRWYDAEAGPDAVAETSAWLLARMVELFAVDLPLLPGVAGLLGSLRDAGVPQALVSSSYRVLVDAVLAHGIGPFDVTVAGDEVEQGKPHPEPYGWGSTRATASSSRTRPPGWRPARQPAAPSSRYRRCPVWPLPPHRAGW